ncbi:MAG: hypothetical protein JWN67_2074 [Actinomycetia bacterium]|nr:hypothetical protein [Actinomycetes bacterium]
MRPDVTEQLRGIRQILAEVVAPEVTEPYPADVLAGALATLDLLADAWAEVPRFLCWDSAATAHVLRLAGLRTTPMPDDLLDLAALRAHHQEVRGLLEASMPTILEHDAARTAVVQLFRDRAERYPLAARPQGGFAAHAAR